VDRFVGEDGASNDQVTGGAEFSNFSEELSVLVLCPVPCFPKISSLSVLSVSTLALKSHIRTLRSLFGLLSRTA
jgi:hypothetical protein